MSNPFIEGEALRQMSQQPKPMTLNGTRELVSEGARALEALWGHVQDMPDDAELAEFYVFENMPAKAIVCDDNGSTTLLWSGEKWIEGRW